MSSPIRRRNSNSGGAGHQFARYVVNGLIATVVHFAVLSFNLQVLRIEYAGVANLIAAAFGITASFIGSRYFVFDGRGQPLLQQAAKFWLLYAAIAALHGAVLFLWSDWLRFDYRIGFLIATGLQMILSFFGNKLLVFR
jgi:putative flippase GtrA